MTVTVSSLDLKHYEDIAVDFDRITLTSYSDVADPALIMTLAKHVGRAVPPAIQTCVHVFAMSLG